MKDVRPDAAYRRAETRPEEGAVLIPRPGDASRDESISLVAIGDRSDFAIVLDPTARGEHRQVDLGMGRQGRELPPEGGDSSRVVDRQDADSTFRGRARHRRKPV